MKKMVVVYGPTGVGKSEIAVEIAKKLSGEIINADVGQFYESCTIGTAKPDWSLSKVPHHLFDIMTDPKDINVIEFRKKVVALVNDIWQRGNIPVVVGGSTFYIMSLFFPPLLNGSSCDSDRTMLEADDNVNEDNLWDALYKIDPVRAHEINKRDTYRLKRALRVWKATGLRPSSQKPVFDPIASTLLCIIQRDKEDLYKRIDIRLDEMMDRGWINEVKELIKKGWRDFLLRKKLLGYDDIVRYLDHEERYDQLDNLLNLIAKKTKMYSKRQRVFGAMLLKKLAHEKKEQLCLPLLVDASSLDMSSCITMIQSNFATL